MKKLAQFLAVIFAVSMITVYVLQAQRSQQARPAEPSPPVVAFSSKSAAPAIRTPIPGLTGTPTNLSRAATNAGHSGTRGIASGSKSMVPLVTYPEKGPATELLNPLPPPKVLPGSKGAPIFPTVPVQSSTGPAKPEFKVKWQAAAPAAPAASPTNTTTAARTPRKGQ